MNEAVLVERRDRANRRLLGRLAIVAAVMFGFGFALVPLYKQLCDALGINFLGERSGNPGNTQIDYSRKIGLEFDANAHNLPWQFKPLTPNLSIHPGELTTVEYEVTNLRDHPVTGQALPSFGPSMAGAYVKKLECFCFRQQTLAAGETRRMPVVLLIDSKLPAEINTVTLSYTFFEVAGRGGSS
ncbi:MAG: cytochrome c oxidase assembly protein [Bryobacteraceae bacterium]